ncbi:putative E3 ubiquitin-protein ligase UBR7 [Menidia menidia]
MSEEQTVSLVDVLQEDQELEEEASAVLAGSDSDHCSYPEGYVKRQALYACSSCSPRGGPPAGVCLACSYKCHEGHELFELYTKRNFRCDCGNGKFSELQCKLYPEKDDANSLNLYSQNFFGLYCTCSRPYPDPEDQVEDEMIQCVVCEDWLHGRHLGCAVPDSVELQEMICESCMNKNPFLWTYAAHLAVPGEAIRTKEEAGESNSNAPDTEKVDDSARPSKRSREEAESSCRLKDLHPAGPDRVQQGALESSCRLKDLHPGGPARVQQGALESSCRLKDLHPGGPDRVQQGALESSCRLKDLHPGGPARVQQGALESSCRLKDLHPGGPDRVQQGALESSCRLKDLHPGGPDRVQQGAVFWPSAWRSKLCPCSSCQELLATAGLSFLLDESDTVLAYENKGKSSEQRPGPDPLMSALDSLNRVQQLEIIHGYNDMKTELKDFLQRFATEGKVVTSEDIRHFFEQQGRKRRRVDGESFHSH